MIIDVKYLLGDCYVPCVLTYFGQDKFDTYPFLRNLYDTQNNRNANVKAIYMFSERQMNFKTTDAESFLFQNGLILLPLFLPVNYVRYADDRAISDVVLTMYSPMLVGIWNKAREYINSISVSDMGTTSIASTSLLHHPLPPIEIHVQRDCALLRELHNRINDRLFNMIYGNNNCIFKQMEHTTANSVERTGKSTVQIGW